MEPAFGDSLVDPTSGGVGHVVVRDTSIPVLLAPYASFIACALAHEQKFVLE
jgi:hypothetical protein